jgi:hypothetical protein
MRELVKLQIDNRFGQFDAIFVRLMESQVCRLSVCVLFSCRWSLSTIFPSCLVCMPLCLNVGVFRSLWRFPHSSSITFASVRVSSTALSPTLPTTASCTRAPNTATSLPYPRPSLLVRRTTTTTTGPSQRTAPHRARLRPHRLRLSSISSISSIMRLTMRRMRRAVHRQTARACSAQRAGRPPPMMCAFIRTHTRTDSAILITSSSSPLTTHSVCHSELFVCI